jgi:RNA polymerase sigma factor (sigma-70 family)
MPTLDPADRELLTRYVRADDHDAFAEIVRRYVGLVYAAARRQTHDPNLADDVTQAVMIVLARRAGTIAPDAVLASWLFTVTRHCAQNAMKIQARQRYHERRAVAAGARVERAVESPAMTSNIEVREVLDEAIARLPEPERSGVVLHYFQHRSHEQIGAALGMSRDAARKRVERALDKMRLFLAGRGVVAGAAALSAALHSEAASAAAIALPAQLASSAVNVALLSSAGSAPAALSGSGSLAIAEGVTRMFTLVKLKSAAAVAIAALVLIGVAGATVVPLLRHTPVETMLITSTSAAQQPADPADAQPPSVQVTKDVRIELLGVSPFPGDEDSWFSISGDPIPMPELAREDPMRAGRNEPDYKLLLRIDAPDDVAVLPRIKDASLSSNARMDGDAGRLMLCQFALREPGETASLEIGVAASPWKTIASSEQVQEQVEVESNEYGTITFLPPEPDNALGGIAFSVEHAPLNLPIRAVGIDAAGKQHRPNNVNVRVTNDESVTTFTFELEPDAIKKIELQVRPYDKFVHVDGISLVAGQKTTPKITVTDAKDEK